MFVRNILLGLAIGISVSACQPDAAVQSGNNGAGADAAPTLAEALAFLAVAEEQLRDTYTEASHASWIANTFISYDSQVVEAGAMERATALSVRLANEAARYNNVALDEPDRRKMEMLKQVLTLPAPQDPAKTRELAEIGSRLSAMYGSGSYCREVNGAEQCLSGDQMENIMTTSRDPDELLDIWVNWREVSPPMKELYIRQVEIGNEGARELGYDNLSTFWRSKYDMDADELVADADAKWEQVKPLYDALHCHVRDELNQYYGDSVVPASGPIPAHVLGNQWAQQWSSIYDLVRPENTDLGYSLDDLVVTNVQSEIEMVEIAEGFFTSLGFEPLPDTFWDRSMMLEPVDHQAVCHASAWNMNYEDDLRIKMCIDRSAEDFQTIHHELGHNFYQRAYNQQPILFQESANDGFHEAVGDTIALSITPSYLVQLGWLDEEPGTDGDLGYLMNMALDKIAFLPFGLLIDKWRWQVFNGEITPAEYNQAWWDLRRQYQGIVAPVERSEANFDPGAKYHIPGNTPYLRYFLAFIQQFQFHRALCDAAGYEGPLHRCSIYGNEAAGQKLMAMLEMGASRPWQEAMEAMTGQRELDASAIIDYFAPLQQWLEEQNQGRSCGW
ncbi:MAG: M2 family metallopeptidase [Gammaproteobacteria bacterium]